MAFPSNLDNDLGVGYTVEDGQVVSVGEITEGQFALETEMEMILVNATAEQIEGIEAGMTVTVYSNGAMTMSLPPQTTAMAIEFVTAAE